MDKGQGKYYRGLLNYTGREQMGRNASKDASIKERKNRQG